MDNLDTFVGRLLHATKLRETELGATIGNKELAAKAGISPSAVSQWMHGNVNTENLKAAHVFRVARFLRVRPEWLWEKRGPMREAPDEMSASTRELLADLKKAAGLGLVEIAIPAMRATLAAILALHDRFHAPLLDLNAPTHQAGLDSNRKRRRG